VSIKDLPIYDLAQAKRYFIALGCSHFRVAGENTHRWNEYNSLRISSETEDQWRHEEIERFFSDLTADEPEKADRVFGRLKSIIRIEPTYLERILALADSLQDTLPDDQFGSVLSVIIGSRGSATHGGLIEKAYQTGRQDLTLRFIACARSYIRKAEGRNIPIAFLRGYLADVIQSLGLNADGDDLNRLRERDNSENFRYYLQGAKEGRVSAMRALAHYYDEGIGCQADMKKSVYWLARASGGDTRSEDQDI